jgi:hypothetical protein
MVFKRKTDQVLEEWVGSYVSETHQNSEEARKFYLFVSQYLLDHGYRMNQRGHEGRHRGQDSAAGLRVGKSTRAACLRAGKFSGSDS